MRITTAILSLQWENLLHAEKILWCEFEYDWKKSALKRIMARLHAPVYESRVHKLVCCIMPYLREGDLVLDVGCGFGALGKAIKDSPMCPPGVHITGLERVRRGGELIEVQAYDGSTIPYADGTYDVVILADVLHHEPKPDHLFRECLRVSRRLVVIKDHQLQGVLAQWRISLLDWRQTFRTASRALISIRPRHNGRIFTGVMGWR